MRIRNEERKHCSFVFLMVALLAFVCGSCVGSQATAQEPQNELVAGPGDTLHISVFAEPLFEQRVSVSSEGVARFYLLGEVKVQGLTVNQIAAKLESQYNAGSFLIHPSINVSIEMSASMQVSVFGEVHNPGAYDLNTGRSIADVLALAGGLNEDADRRIVIRRKNGGDVTAFVTNLPSNPAYTSAIVYPGDTVIVSKAGLVYILGDVNRPGGYFMQRDSALSALQAITMAGGMPPNAAAPHAKIVRKDASNPKGYVDIPLQLRAMQKGKIPDMQLQADDIIYVPFSYGRNFIIQSPAIMASATSALIYTHP